MFGKLVFFFVVTVLTYQTFGRSLDEEEIYGISDIIAAIKEIIEKVKNAIIELTGNFPNIIKDLRNKIEELINKFNINNIVKQIKKKFDDIVHEIGVDVSAAKQCFEASKPEVQNLVDETKDKLASCKKTADDRTDELSEEFTKLKERASEFSKTVSVEVTQCWKEGGLNLVKVYSCLKSKFDEISKEGNALIKQIGKTISSANKTAADITITLTECIVEITLDVNSKEREIIKNFTTCVESLKH